MNEIGTREMDLADSSPYWLAETGDARSWLNLQSAYHLRVAEISNAKRIAREVSPAAA
jgi:hypothetical protein